MTTVMSTLPSSFTVTDKLRDKLLQSYNGILLHISDKLDSNHLYNLRQYCHGLIPVHVTDTMDVLRTLQYKGKISWDNTHLLKEAMFKIGRIDIAQELTEFEIKRDLTLLLDFYTNMILDMDMPCGSVPVKLVKIVAGQLIGLMKGVREKLNFGEISLTVETSRHIRKALVDFEVDIHSSEVLFSWNDFTMLVIIAGEIIVAASLDEERQVPVIELCFTAADELCPLMTELGDWEDFCTRVKERYNLICNRQSMESNPRLILQKQRAEVVKQLKDAIFF